MNRLVPALVALIGLFAFDFLVQAQETAAPKSTTEPKTTTEPKSPPPPAAPPFVPPVYFDSPYHGGVRPEGDYSWYVATLPVNPYLTSGGACVSGGGGHGSGKTMVGNYYSPFAYYSSYKDIYGGYFPRR